MKRSDLARRVRDVYLDDAIEPFKWTAEWMDWAINRAQDEACRRSRLIFDDTTAAICTISVETGTAEYTASSRIIEIENIRYDSEPVEAKSVGWLDRNSPNWKTQTSATPNYVTGRGRTIIVVGVPSEDYTLSLDVWRLPLEDMDEDVDTFEIPDEYHDDLMDYVAFEAFMIRRTSTYDKKKASDHLSRFTERFGKRRSATDQRNLITATKKVRFTPYPYTPKRNTYLTSEDW